MTDNISVWMIHRALHQAPVYALPEGYRMRFFQAGDVEQWVRIQQAADRYQVPTEASFYDSMPDAALVRERVMFLVDPAGCDIGSITAWNEDQLLGHDVGLVHWVALLPEVQGQGLGKPLTSAALQLMQAQGYAEAWLETGSARIPALNLYLHFGFQPYVRGEADRSAWKQVSPLLKFPISV
jgi:GNAT superfamily N-acetyltransferase